MHARHRQLDRDHTSRRIQHERSNGQSPRTNQGGSPQNHRFSNTDRALCFFQLQLQVIREQPSSRDLVLVTKIANFLGQSLGTFRLAKSSVRMRVYATHHRASSLKDLTDLYGPGFRYRGIPYPCFDDFAHSRTLMRAMVRSLAARSNTRHPPASLRPAGTLLITSPRISVSARQSHCRTRKL